MSSTNNRGVIYADDDADLSSPAYWRSLIAGNTATDVSEEGKTLHIYYAPNGVMKGKGNLLDSGAWEITDDGIFCRRWEKWRNGGKDCFSMDLWYGGDEFYFEAIDKPYKLIFTLRQGDPEQLSKGTNE